jgi:hypothetical protein
MYFNVNNNMAGVRIYSLAFNLTAASNEVLELGKLNLIRK